tara:strand:- start:342 stop:875 length:534 start_codon:yes stop_codon:yes gene_type:complete
MAVTISNQLYSEEDMLRIWNGYWTNNNKAYLKVTRRERLSSGYFKTALSTVRPMYFIAYDGEVPVAYSGIEDNGTFNASAGMYIIPEYQKQGLAERLLDKKLEKTGSKPYITFINNLEPYWVRFLNRKGLIKADINNIPEGIPKDIVQTEIDGYGEDNVLIYHNVVTKAWHLILKRY